MYVCIFVLHCVGGLKASYTAVCVDIGKCEPKSYVHEYNYVANFLYCMHRKPNHIIIFMCTVVCFTVRSQPNSSTANHKEYLQVPMLVVRRHGLSSN